MLEDRDYMRAENHGGRWIDRLPVALWLVILNAVFYAAQLIVPLAGAAPGHPPPRLEPYLALRPGDLLHGYVWQLLTFQLLHAGPLHLVLNCAMLYIFGRPVEHALGKAHLLKLYFGSGAFGGLLQAACAWVFPAHFGMGSVVGASAGVFGLIAAFATIHSEMSVTMLLFFFLPVTMKAKYLLLVEVVLAVFGMLDVNSQIAHAAHLGGMIAGVVYIRQVIHWRWRPVWRVKSRAAAAPRKLVGVRARRDLDGPRAPVVLGEDLSPEDFLVKEVDPILDKISAHGIQSLTEREKRILESARRKMQGR